MGDSVVRTEINSCQRQDCHSSLQQRRPELKGIGDGVAAGNLCHNGASNFDGHQYQNSCGCDPPKSSDGSDKVLEPSDEQQPEGATEVGFSNICDAPTLADESEKPTSMQAGHMVTGHSCVKCLDTCVCFNREGSRFLSPGISDACSSSPRMNSPLSDTGQQPLCQLEPVSMRSSENFSDGRLVLSEDQGQSCHHQSNDLPPPDSQETANSSNSVISDSFSAIYGSNQCSGVESACTIADLVEQSVCGELRLCGPQSSRAVEEHLKIPDPMGTCSDVTRERTSDHCIVDEGIGTTSHKDFPVFANSEETHTSEQKSADPTITQVVQTRCLDQVVRDSAAESSPAFESRHSDCPLPSKGNMSLPRKNDEGAVENVSAEKFTSDAALGEYYEETLAGEGIVKSANESEHSVRDAVIKQTGEIERTKGRMNSEHSHDHSGNGSQVGSEIDTGNSPYMSQKGAENEIDFSQSQVKETKETTQVEMEVGMGQPLKKDEKGSVQFEGEKGAAQTSSRHDGRTDEKCDKFSGTLRTNIELGHETHMCTMVKFANGICKYIKDEPVSDGEDSFYCSNTRGNDETYADADMDLTHIQRHLKREPPSAETQEGSQSFGGPALQQSPERTDSDLSQTCADKTGTFFTPETDSSGSSLIPGSTEREAATDGQSSCEYDSEGWQLGSDDGQGKSTASTLHRDESNDGMSCGKEFCAAVRCPDCKKLTCTCKMEEHKLTCTQSSDLDTGFVEATCTCPECGVDFYKKEDLTIHLSIHEVLARNAQKMRETCSPEPHGCVREDSQNVNNEPNASNEVSRCSICERTFPDPTMGPYHEMMHEKYPVHCSKCNVFFSTLLDLHQQRCFGKKHHKVFKYRCAKCRCIKLDSHKMMRHRARCDGHKEMCGKCKQKFYTFKELARHVEVCPSDCKDAQMVEEHKLKVSQKEVNGPSLSFGKMKDKHLEHSAARKRKRKKIKKKKRSAVLEKVTDLPENIVATSQENCQICGRHSPELIQSHAKSNELHKLCSDCMPKVLERSGMSKSRKRIFSPCHEVSEKSSMLASPLSQTDPSSVISTMVGNTWTPLTKKARKSPDKVCVGCGCNFEDFPSLRKHVSECKAIDNKKQSLQEFADSEKTPPTPYQQLNHTPPSQQIHCTSAIASMSTSIDDVAMGSPLKDTSQRSAVEFAEVAKSSSPLSVRVPSEREAAVSSSDSRPLGCRLENPHQVPAKSFERNIVCVKGGITNTRTKTPTGDQISKTLHILEQIDASFHSLAKMNASSSSSGQQTHQCVVSHHGNSNPVHKQEDTGAGRPNSSLSSKHIVTVCSSEHEKKAERGTDDVTKQPSFQNPPSSGTLIQSCKDSQIEKCSLAGGLRSLESKDVMPEESIQESALYVPIPVADTTHQMSLVPQVSKCVSLAANSTSSERVGNVAIPTLPLSVIKQDFEEVRKGGNNDSPNGIICNRGMEQQSPSHQDASERKPNDKSCQDAPPEMGISSVFKDCRKRLVPKRLHTLRNEMKVTGGNSKNKGMCGDVLIQEPSAVLSDSVSTSVKVEPDVERGNSAKCDIASGGDDVTHFCVYCLEEYHSREKLWMHAAVCRDAHLVSISSQVTGGLERELNGLTVAKLNDPVPFTVVNTTYGSRNKEFCGDIDVNLKLISVCKNEQMRQQLIMRMKSRKKKKKKKEKKKKKKKKKSRLPFSFSRGHRHRHRDVRRAVHLKCELCNRKFESRKQFEKHKRAHVTKRVKKKLKLELRKLSPSECAEYSRDCGSLEQSVVVKGQKPIQMSVVKVEPSSTKNVHLLSEAPSECGEYSRDCGSLEQSAVVKGQKTIQMSAVKVEPSNNVHSLSEAGVTMSLGESCVMQATANNSVLDATEPAAPRDNGASSSSSKHRVDESQSIPMPACNGEPKKKKSPSVVGVTFPPVIEVFCQVCGQKFGHPSTLERHAKLHQS
ncbi:uncharacterized protein [Diadema setosum]|uniref:uncharacterized protein n=1 Tax=Diadema setosum TaxID=31175 RepID=UPI003B3A62C3